MSKKTSTTTTKTEPVVAVVPVNELSAGTPAVDKKVRKPKAAKTETESVVAAVVPESAPAVELTVTEVSTDVAPDAGSELAKQSGEFLTKLQSLGVFISALKTEYRALEKKWTHELKVAQKQSSKRKRKAGNRAPSGFVKPTKISDELASFLGKEMGTEMARTDVTREINAYIRAHKLQDKDNGRKINPDSKLATLLKLKKTDELTYFNLQKYMSPHFAKAIKVAAVEATV